MTPALILLGILLIETSIPILGPLRVPLISFITILRYKHIKSLFALATIGFLVYLFYYPGPSFDLIYKDANTSSICILSAAAMYILGSRNQLPVKMINFTLAILLLCALIQLALPGISNRIFTIFLADYYEIIPLGRPSLFSMEPSFASEMVFFLLLYRLLLDKKILAFIISILGSLLILRTGTLVQNTLIFLSFYSIIRLIHSHNFNPRFSQTSAFAVTIIGISSSIILLNYYLDGTFGVGAFLDHSLFKFGSWRTISNIAAMGASQPFGFGAGGGTFGWQNGLALGQDAVGINIDWITNPFSIGAMVFLDYGYVPALGLLTILCNNFLITQQTLKPNDYPLNGAIFYSTLFLITFTAPKWASYYFLILGSHSAFNQNKVTQINNRPTLRDNPEAL